MAELQAKNPGIANLSKLEALLFEFRGIKTTFESEVNEAIESIEEDDAEYTSKAHNFMKELREVSDVAAANEAIIERFYKKLSMDEKPSH